MDEQEQMQAQEGAIKEAVNYAYQQIMDAAMTYYPYTPQFRETVSGMLSWLAEKVYADTSTYYEQARYKRAQEQTFTVVSAVLAGIEVAQREGQAR